ncbi:hypothetical protein Q3G72_019115 [Acer saccharum]|nr:hypothetical protein Q3G72_019115 [Acer saccharum]
MLINFKAVLIWFVICSNSVLLFYTTCRDADINVCADEDFIGDLNRISVARTNETNLDDPSVSQRGFSMMTELAAITPNQPLMFKTVMLDAGDKGKRYGMAQCHRDISSADCDSCLADQLMSFSTTVGNVRE